MNSKFEMSEVSRVVRSRTGLFGTVVTQDFNLKRNFVRINFKYKKYDHVYSCTIYRAALYHSLQ